MLLSSFPKAVIFDFDNTLVDTLSAIHAAFNDTLAFCGHQKWSEQELKNNIKFSPREYLPKILGVDIARVATEYYLEAYKKRSDGLIKPLEKAAEVLDLLKEREIPLYVVSNKRGKILRHEIKNLLNWEKYFQKVVGSEDCEHDKPHPQVVEYALGYRPNKDVWFIGDSDVDIACAQNSGCWSILINNDSNLKLEYKPDLQYPSLNSLLDQLRKLPHEYST